MFRICSSFDTLVQEQQRDQEREIQILQREKSVIEDELGQMRNINSTQTDKLTDLSDTLNHLSSREDNLQDRNRDLAEENRRLYNQLNTSKFDLEQHQLLCEKLVTEALREEDRLQGTIESLKNKLSHTTSLTFSEVIAPTPAIQTPDRCYKGMINSDNKTWRNRNSSK